MLTKKIDTQKRTKTGDSQGMLLLLLDCTVKKEASENHPAHE